jgi:putative oxidoreductase
VAVLNVAVEVVGPIALIIGLWPLLTALALIALALVTTWTTYRFGIFGAVFKQPQPVVLMKNLAVIAGLLFYTVSGPGAWSRTGLRRA